MSLIDMVAEDTSPSPEVQNILTRSLIALRDEDGFTIHPKDGRDYAGRWWTVGGIIPTLIIEGQDELVSTTRRIEEWYEAALILDTVPLIGGWSYEGRLHLDMVTLIKDEEQARLLGKMWNQISIARRNDDDEMEFVSIFTD